MGDAIVDVDDIKDQLNLVVNELRSFVARLEDMKASNRGLYCGFDRFFELADRQKSIAERLKPGKAPSKQTVFLMLCIIDAMKNGPISEKEIKEHIMRKCRIYDIKSTNRGTVAGSNIEVSAACHILSSVGIIESFSENQKDKRGSRSSSFSAMENSVPDYGSFRDKYVAEKLLEILSARWAYLFPKNTKFQNLNLNLSLPLLKYSNLITLAMILSNHLHYPWPATIPVTIITTHLPIPSWMMEIWKTL